MNESALKTSFFKMLKNSGSPGKRDYFYWL